ncbi:hypothetical protein VTO42DRAFT_3056 [Malbranchea cinnamomea]
MVSVDIYIASILQRLLLEWTGTPIRRNVTAIPRRMSPEPASASVAAPQIPPAGGPVYARGTGQQCIVM